MQRKSHFQVLGVRGFTGPRRASALSALEAWERKMMKRGFSAREMHDVEWERRNCRLVELKPDGTVDRII